VTYPLIIIKDYNGKILIFWELIFVESTDHLVFFLMNHIDNVNNYKRINEGNKKVYNIMRCDRNKWDNKFDL
jgi:hypothetical protein